MQAGDRRLAADGAGRHGMSVLPVPTVAGNMPVHGRPRYLEHERQFRFRVLIRKRSPGLAFGCGYGVCVRL